MIYTSHYESALGGITLAGNEMALIGLWFDGQKHFGATLPEEYKEKDLPIFEHTFWKKEQFPSRKDILSPPAGKNRMQSGGSCAILNYNDLPWALRRAGKTKGVNDDGTAFEDSGRQRAAADRGHCHDAE